jgi:predicted glycosyltransferase
MKKIAYYISDYGFGHATRSSGIIKDLLQEIVDVEITVCNSFAMPFLQ